MLAAAQSCLRQSSLPVVGNRRPKTSSWDPGPGCRRSDEFAAAGWPSDSPWPDPAGGLCFRPVGHWVVVHYLAMALPTQGELHNMSMGQG